MADINIITILLSVAMVLLTIAVFLLVLWSHTQNGKIKNLKKALGSLYGLVKDQQEQLDEVVKLMPGRR